MWAPHPLCKSGWPHTGSARGFSILLLTWQASEGICLVPADHLKGQRGSRPPDKWVTLWSRPSAALEHITRLGDALCPPDNTHCTPARASWAASPPWWRRHSPRCRVSVCTFGARGLRNRHGSGAARPDGRFWKGRLLTHASIHPFNRHSPGSEPRSPGSSSCGRWGRRESAVSEGEAGIAYGMTRRA
uniref:Uncharacterized protein n=1 Tax=Molossus molossus TaxID=27622 RepID=A0A7J8FYW3_MOLMO|nr:hypothetical protein HJG59_008137 [Molossus molossus]